MIKAQKLPWILYLGTYPPRECGIATFTRDLSSAIAEKLPEARTKIMAMNKGPVQIYNYPQNVVYQVNESHHDEYQEAAKWINRNHSIQLVSIQHEFGIFGGEWGESLLTLLENLEKNVVITFHSVLPNPDPKLKYVVQRIGQKVSCIIVMTAKGVEILRKDYGVRGVVKVIPHGIPTVPFEGSAKFKTRLGLRDKLVLSSFGFISDNKGYEYVIDALPALIKEFPHLIYLIVGETHPLVLKKEGERYRNFLEERAEALGLHAHVKFYNKYLTLQEITKYLQATDIYISSALNPYQITSGTLVYAMGAGRPVISTSFAHAQDILTAERGFLVDFENANLFEKAIRKLAQDPPLREQMGRNCYAYTRQMTWPNVALSYIQVFNQCAQVRGAYKKQLPPIRLKHLLRLSDNFGVIQFADYVTPDRQSGYTVDDVARALIALVMHYRLYHNQALLKYINIYLNFIEFVQAKDGCFYNLANFAREVDHSSFSQDAHGRSLWALGYLISCPRIPITLKAKAKSLFEKGLPAISQFSFPRAKAFAILGLFYLYRTYPSASLKEKIKELADDLVQAYFRTATPHWQWFEEILAYSNARLPEALFRAYLATREKIYLEIGEITLHFLKDVTFPTRKRFQPVGQDGWYMLGGKRAEFDQQPIDVAAMVQALLLYFEIRRRQKYLDQALDVFDWFLGNNTLEQVIYDQTTGGCNDGLGKEAINLNQGAESTISYLLARLSLEQVRKRKS